MPRPVNQIRITGTVTSDPKIYVNEKDGKQLKIANFSIAFDWWHGNKLKPCWYFNCVSFNYAADAVDKFIRKGSRILITDGYIQPNKYKSKEGIEKEIIKIVVDDFILVGYNKEMPGKDINTIEDEITDIDEIVY